MKYIKKRSKHRTKSKGFSLIEMMVVVGIIGFVIIGLVSFFTGGARSWISGQNQLKAQREARMVMDRMVKEIRGGKSVETGSDGDTIIVSFPDELGGGNVKYELVGNTISRNDVNTMIENIPEGGLYFSYYDDQDSSTGTPTQASKLRILLQVDVDGDMETGGNADVVIETEVNLRNFGIVGS